MARPVLTRQPGDVVTVRALRADGACYRRWAATVEREAALVGARRGGQVPYRSGPSEASAAGASDFGAAGQVDSTAGQGDDN